MLPSDALRACLQTLLESEDSVELTEALKRDLASHEPGPAVAACLLHTLEACGDLPEQQKGTAADACMEAFLELLGSCSEHTCYAPALVASLDWAVAHGNPRDLLLHCLAAVDMLTLDGRDLTPPEHGLLQQVVAATARLLQKLPRRRTATLLDCLPTILRAAEVQGPQLQQLHVCLQQQRQQQQQQEPQLQTSALQQLGPVAAAPMDPLVASWQPYVALAVVAAQIVEGEVDPQLKQQACEQLTSGVCQLLLWLTACWQPPGWPLAWQSLALPPAVAGGCTQAGGAGGDGVVVDAAASAPVGQLLRVVAGCGVHSWEDLQQVATDGAAAAVTATYTLQPSFASTLCPRVDSSTMVRLCCSWAQQLAQWASDVDWGEAEGAMRVALLWKAAILLWSTGRAAAAAADGDDRGEGPDVGGNRDGGPSEDAAASADDVPTEELLHELQSAVSMFSFTMVQVPAPSVRRLLHLALQQLLKGLRPRLRLACLQALLMGAHPEEAALLLQCVQQLVEGLMQAAGRSSPGDGNTLAGALGLCVSMLQQAGPRGWQTPDQLPEVANALAAAVAALDYALLRSRRQLAPGAAADTATVQGTVQCVKQELGQVLTTLDRGVQDAMQQLGAGGHDQSTGKGGEGMGASLGDGAGDDGNLDALLALQRLQLSLEHVQQSLRG